MIASLTLEPGQRTRQRLLGEDHIAIRKQEPFPCSKRCSTRHRMRLPQPTRCQFLHMLHYIPHAALAWFPFQGIHHQPCLIGRPVIDGNHLEFHALRRQQGAQPRANALPSLRAGTITLNRPRPRPGVSLRRSDSRDIPRSHAPPRVAHSSATPHPTANPATRHIITPRPPPRMAEPEQTAPRRTESPPRSRARPT